MQTRIFLFLTLLAVLATGMFGQPTSDYQISVDSKGITPIRANGQSDVFTGITRAVVIGISDYQSPNIPDLRYAAADANAFVTYLKSPSGGKLDEKHLRILLNKDATTAQIAAALDWLIEESQEGDQCIIYFSGHGDVETKTATQLGFLLTWDSPPQSYIAGAFPVYYLQAVISTLSSKNKSKVMLITDACRAGKLAGSQNNGTQATTANLAQQFGNETKILSCQPDELSLEGEQWGGGRGVFSFYLINALMGMADTNGDNQVSLREVERYLEDHVAQDVNPQHQTPMMIGNKTENLAHVDTAGLKEYVARLKFGHTTITDLASRSQNPLQGVSDTSILDMYQHFQVCLEKKQFFSPEQDCAEFYYRCIWKRSNQLTLLCLRLPELMLWHCRMSHSRH